MRDCVERCSARSCRCPGDPADRTGAAPYAATETGYRLAEGYGRIKNDAPCGERCPDALFCFRNGCHSMEVGDA